MASASARVLAKRLFTKDMCLPGFGRGDRHLGMEKSRRSDVNGVDVIALEHFSPIGLDLRPAPAVGESRRSFSSRPHSDLHDRFEGRIKKLRATWFQAFEWARPMKRWPTMAIRSSFMPHGDSAQADGLKKVDFFRRIWDANVRVKMFIITLTHVRSRRRPKISSAIPLAALEHHFGFREFLAGQEPVVSSLLAGRDTLAVMPTGGGKSLCYQLPAMVMEGVTLVVSPLIALMKDQVDGLVRKGVPATMINSTLSPAEQIRAAPRDWRPGKLQARLHRAGALSQQPVHPRAEAESPSPSSRSTRPTASASGVTTSGPITCALRGARGTRTSPDRSLHRHRTRRRCRPIFQGAEAARSLHLDQRIRTAQPEPAGEPLRRKSRKIRPTPRAHSKRSEPASSTARPVNGSRKSAPRSRAWG
jgi:hypothetical protein